MRRGVFAAYGRRAADDICRWERFCLLTLAAALRRQNTASKSRRRQESLRLIVSAVHLALGDGRFGGH